MARIWREHKTPDGSNYYYNIKTKQTTRERPADFLDQEPENRKKRLPGSQRSVLFTFELIDGWKLVLCQDGSKHYTHNENEKLFDDVDNESCKQVLAQLDEEKLKRLADLARSQKNGSTQLYEDISNDIARIKSLPEEAAVENEDEPEFSFSDSDASAEENVVTGYGTSDDESEDNDGTNGSDDNDSGERASSKTTESENKIIFKKLLESYSLDPFSTWRIQSRKLQDDPRFYRISKDSTREQYFEEWCAEQCNNGNVTENIIDALDESNIESESELDSDTLEPTKYHYLSHIVSKSAIQPTTLAKDIRAEQKGLFKQFKIKSTLDGKSQVAFISKLLFYYKKLDDSQRINVFEKFLKDKARSIKRGLRNHDRLREILDSSLPDEAFTIETQLLEMEDCIDIHGLNRSLQDDIEYYVLGLKPKTIAMRAWFKKELDVSS
ncbi:LAFA_0D02300g1_1 [Lachancea sp. 'fantastica']|nr:LAFA_0D02300g1_1 [Lachancea sp. 'fantastica']